LPEPRVVGEPQDGFGNRVDVVARHHLGALSLGQPFVDRRCEARDEGVEIYPLPLRADAAGEVLLEQLVLPQEV